MQANHQVLCLCLTRCRKIRLLFQHDLLPEFLPFNGWYYTRPLRITTFRCLYTYRDHALDRSWTLESNLSSGRTKHISRAKTRTTKHPTRHPLAILPARLSVRTVHICRLQRGRSSLAQLGALIWCRVPLGALSSKRTF